MKKKPKPTSSKPKAASSPLIRGTVRKSKPAIELRQKPIQGVDYPSEIFESTESWSVLCAKYRLPLSCEDPRRFKKNQK